MTFLTRGNELFKKNEKNIGGRISGADEEVKSFDDKSRHWCRCNLNKNMWSP